MPNEPTAEAILIFLAGHWPSIAAMVAASLVTAYVVRFRMKVEAELRDLESYKADHDRRADDGFLRLGKVESDCRLVTASIEQIRDEMQRAREDALAAFKRADDLVRLMIEAATRDRGERR